MAWPSKTTLGVAIPVAIVSFFVAVGLSRERSAAVGLGRGVAVVFIVALVVWARSKDRPTRDAKK